MYVSLGDYMCVCICVHVSLYVVYMNFALCIASIIICYCDTLVIN